MLLLAHYGVEDLFLQLSLPFCDSVFYVDVELYLLDDQLGYLILQLLEQLVALAAAVHFADHFSEEGCRFVVDLLERSPDLGVLLEYAQVPEQS